VAGQPGPVEGVLALFDPLLGSASANRRKGARGAEDWKPADKGYWCDYASDWVQIKADWDLSLTNAEWEALQEMLGTCDTKPSVTTIP
jgi:hypothetical protein